MDAYEAHEQFICRHIECNQVRRIFSTKKLRNGHELRAKHHCTNCTYCENRKPWAKQKKTSQIVCAHNNCSKGYWYLSSLRNHYKTKHTTKCTSFCNKCNLTEDNITNPSTEVIVSNQFIENLNFLPEVDTILFGDSQISNSIGTQENVVLEENIGQTTIENIGQNNIENITVNNLPKLEGVKWTRFLRKRKQMDTVSPDSIKRSHKRLKQGLTSLITNYSGCSLLESLKILLHNEEELLTKLVESSNTNLRGKYIEEGKESMKPSIATLSKIKDLNKISDKAWDFTMELLQFKHVRLSKIKQFERKANPVPLHSTNDANGWKTNIIDIISLIIKHSNIPENYKLKIKLSFDGSYINNQKKTPTLIGAIDIIYDSLTPSQVKSPDNSYIWLIYLSNESRENLMNALEEEGIKDINNLLSMKEIVVNSKRYEVEVVIVCDMACTVKILGLYNTYHTHNKFKCCWCLVTDETIADFDISNWKFRSLLQHIEIAKQIKKKSTKSKNSKCEESYGIEEEPIVNVNFENVIPCSLHLFMRVTHKLFSLLLRRIIDNEDLEKCFEEKLNTLLTLKKYSETEEKQKITLLQRFEDSRINRNDLTRILNNIDSFLEMCDGFNLAKIEEVKEIWRVYNKQIRIVCEDNPDAAEYENWTTIMRKWGRNLVVLEGEDAITPYIHVFIYHVEFFLKVIIFFCNYLEISISGKICQLQY